MYNVLLLLLLLTSVWYEGECRDPAQDGLCGDEALGERLWLTKDGRVQCDCDEVSVFVCLFVFELCIVFALYITLQRLD